MLPSGANASYRHDVAVDDPRDELTGLLAYSALATLRPESCVVLVDLVHFAARINAPYGHAEGDRVLKEAGARLRDGLAPLRVFRSGGDEFVVEASADLDEAGTVALAHRIADLLALPIEGLEQQLEVRIGVALGPVGGDWLHAMMIAGRAADDAGRQRLPVVIATL
jgi:diguanylate cyclase (GGDEF)-like protein